VPGSTSDVIAHALEAGCKPANEANNAIAVSRRSRNIQPDDADPWRTTGVLPGAKHTPMGYTVGPRRSYVNRTAPGISPPTCAMNAACFVVQVGPSSGAMLGVVNQSRFVGR
jgi:hypothetical protein